MGAAATIRRIVLAVAAEDEAAGAGRFYKRFGWSRLARQQKGWCFKE